MFKLVDWGGTPMTHEETVRAARASLLMEDSRETHRNVYPIRQHRQEAEASAGLYPTSQRTVIALPVRPSEPPEAAA